jgi:tRNA A-37 threonylcarbamoyl transferase component Bud32
VNKSSDPSPPNHDADHTPQFEEYILRFENAWRHGNCPDIADFLPTASDSFTTMLRDVVLHELVKIDLEFRCRQNSAALRPEPGARPILLEDYVSLLSELGPLTDLPLDLIVEEYRVRQRFSDTPPHAEYAARFPRHGAALLEKLTEIDADWLRETIPVSSSETFPTPVAKVLSHVDPQAPLFHADYHLERLIGSGGMCKVYAATQKSLGKRVCVKALRKRSRRDTRAVARFLQEANLVARLRHPQIVAIHGLGRLPDNGYFMVMDWVDGHDLAHECHVGPMPPARAAGLVASIAAVIDYVHRRGVLHCDLKPANVLINRDETPLVTDFGLARFLTEAYGDESLVADYIAGTAAFMAPEQANARHGPLGTWTDVYGLGALLYALLTGRPPVAGHLWTEVIDEVASAKVPAAPHELRPEVPQSLSDICLTCLHKEPSHRFATAATLALVLESEKKNIL